MMESFCSWGQLERDKVGVGVMVVWRLPRFTASGKWEPESLHFLVTKT